MIFNKDNLQESWESCQTLDDAFTVWTVAYPCPKCKRDVLDFSAPRLGHPIICRHCYSLFDLKLANTSQKESTK